MTQTMFGTDGIRSAVGTRPLTASSLPQLGHALAQWAHEKYGNNPRILIGHDTRVSCAWVKASLKSSILLYPVTLFDAGVLPTPAVCYLVEKTDQFDLGIIISASHNPYQDNGIKLIDRTNGKLSPEDEQRICQLFNEETTAQNYESLGTEHSYTRANDDYINAVSSFFDATLLKDKTIVLDCAHGATSAVAHTIFERCGATVITINNQPTGTNINAQCGAVHPENLQKKVLEHHADAGCAFDGDGDRITMVNKYGTVMDGDALLALLSTHPAYIKQHTIVSTIMGNHNLSVWLSQQDKTLVRTSVGDKHVGDALKQHNALLGGEPSGHIITRDYLSTGDGIFSALRVLETIAHTNNWDMNSFTACPNILINVPITQKKSLAQEPLAHIIAAYERKLPNGRLVVRYSGTELLLRVMVEDANEHHAHTIGKNLARELQEHLG